MSLSEGVLGSSEDDLEDIERVRTVDEVRDFMAGSEPVDFHLTERRGAYDFVTRTLRRLSYAGLSKADKGVVRRFVVKVTGLSRAQSTRLIGQYQNTGHIRDRRCGATRPFERRYTAVDIRLLAEVDQTLGGLCGPTTRRVMRRQYEVFGDERFERLAGLSNSHLYRMRQSTTYRRRRNPTTKTQATQINIGERRKPHPQGRPGFLRVDSVHQGDLDGRKGVYEVNLVDEVTQYEFVAAVEGISERFLLPALGTDQNAAIHLYTHERACPEARSARGRGCPMTRGRGSARGLVQCRRGRTAEQREPVVDPLSGQALVSAGPLVPSPAPRAQIEPGTE